MQKKRIITVFLISLFFLPLVVLAEGGGIVVSPSIIDEKCKARDMLEYTVKIKNDSENKAFLYAFVNDISKDGVVSYKDPSELDLSSSLTRWIEFRRALIEIEQGEEAEIPLNIKVNHDAPAGNYHVKIAFGEGSNRDLARKNILDSNKSELLINIDVEEHIVEKAEIVEFKPLKNIFTKAPIDFSLKIKNIGNRKIKPQGEIVIYNKGGKELASASFNEGGHSILSGKTEDFPISLNLDEKLGRFKAKLRIEYGQDRKDLQDVVYFLLLPKGALILIGVIILVLVVFLASAINRKKYRHVVERVESLGPRKKVAVVDPEKTKKESDKVKNKDYIIDLKSK